MTLDLKHYPRGGAFAFDPTTTYDQTERYDKPSGLWVSVKGDDDWKAWTQAEDFCASSTTPDNEHTVTLADDANIMMIRSAHEVLTLTDNYGLDPSFSSSFDRAYRIDWPLIATRWDGIIIAPYQWSCRYDDRTFWYYGWDCASGCIWNLHAITDVIAPSVEVAA